MAFCIVLIVILMIAALVGTFVFLLPEKRAPYLSPLLHKVRDFLSMKVLYLEKIQRTLYVIASVITFVLCVFGGLFFPFIADFDGFGRILLGMILGLIVGVILAIILLFFIRIIYENIMLKVMLTDAAKKINLKMGGESEPRVREEPRRRAAPPAPRAVVCRRCGSRYDPRRGYCPNCEDERW